MKTTQATPHHFRPDNNQASQPFTGMTLGIHQGPLSNIEPVEAPQRSHTHQVQSEIRSARTRQILWGCLGAALIFSAAALFGAGAVTGNPLLMFLGAACMIIPFTLMPIFKRRLTRNHIIG